MFFLLFFATFGCAVAFNQYSISISILPSLDNTKHQYYAGMKCPSNDKFFPIYEPLVNRFSTQEGDRTELCTEELPADEECPEGFQIGISMLNEQQEDFTWQTWGAFWINGIKFGENNFIYKKIEFGVHFKLDISPKLNESSNIVYRVNVYCADNGNLEFKTFTNSETDVVFSSNYNTYVQIGAEYVPSSSSEAKKCKKYQVKVWPSNVKRLNYIKEQQEVGNTLLEPEFVASDVITNGKLYNNVKFPVHFNLIIEPSLDHEAEPIYYVKVKCNGKESNTFKTFTHGNTQVVLNVKGCPKFDISVSKMDKEIESPKEISSIRAKMKRIGEKIKNGSTYPIEYNEEQKLPEESEEDNDSLGAEDEKIDDDDNMDDNDDDDLDKEIEQIIKQLEMEKGKGFGLEDNEDEFEDSGDDEVDKDIAPKTKKPRAPPKTKANKATQKIAAKKGKKVLESEDDDEGHLEGSDDDPVKMEDKPKPKKPRAPPKTKANKATQKTAAKKGKKKVLESEDDYKDDLEGSEDDYVEKEYAPKTKRPRAPPKTKINKTTSKIAAKKGKKKVSESEDDFEADWDSGDDDWNMNKSAVKGKKKILESEGDDEEDWHYDLADKQDHEKEKNKMKPSSSIVKKKIVKTDVQGKKQIGDHLSTKESVKDVKMQTLKQVKTEAVDNSDDDDFERPIHKKMKSLNNFEGNLP